MTARMKRIAPLAGVLMVGFLVAALVLPSTPDSKASGAKVAAFFQHHETSIHVQDFLLGYAALAAVVYFASLAGYLRRRGADVLATTTIAGAVLMAGGLLVAAGVAETAVDQPGRLTPAVAQTLNLIGNNLFVFLLMGGLALATTSAGVSMLRTKSLPKAVGIVTLVVGLVAGTGIFSWFAFLASGPLTLVIAGYLYHRIGQPGEIVLPEIPAARAADGAEQIRGTRRTTTTGK